MVTLQFLPAALEAGYSRFVRSSGTARRFGSAKLVKTSDLTVIAAASDHTENRDFLSETKTRPCKRADDSKNSVWATNLIRENRLFNDSRRRVDEYHWYQAERLSTQSTRERGTQSAGGGLDLNVDPSR